MTSALINALANVGTFVVIAASAVAAFVQLKHLRSSYQLEALNDFRVAFESPLMQASRAALPLVKERLTDHASRLELQDTIPEWLEPALPILRLFEVLGLYVQRGIVSSDLVCDLWAPIVVSFWEDRAPLIVVMRRMRGETLYENFEMLACICKDWLAAERSTYPKRMRRIAPPDPWAAEDAAASVAGRAVVAEATR